MSMEYKAYSPGHAEGRGSGDVTGENFDLQRPLSWKSYVR